MEAVYKADVCDQSVFELVQVRDKIAGVWERGAGISSGNRSR